MTVTAVDTGHRKVSRAAEVHAPAGELFGIVADPHRHGELDGSGTVMGTVGGPRRLAQGARFSVQMKQYGVPYRITSRVTDFDDGHVVEWRHPLGHRWRWELTPSSGDSTRVMETFDYSRVGPSMPKHWSCSGTRSRTPRVSRQRCESCRRGIPAAKDLLPPLGTAACQHGLRRG